jgi:hypothetical protein
MVFATTEMKTSFACFTVALLCTLPLQKEFMQGHLPSGKNAQIAMKGHDPFVRLQSEGSPHCDRLLSNTTKPFRDLALPKQDQHFVFDHPGPQEVPIPVDQLGIAIIFSIE